MEGWHDFLIVNAGAAAALAGLVFVGLSINLDNLLKFPAVLYRAAAALVMLLNVLVTSSLMLAPEQSLRANGIQVLLVGAVAWIVVTVLSVKNMRGTAEPYRAGVRWLFCFRQLALLPMIIGAVILTTENDHGMRWMVPAFTLTFIVTLMEAWVILVEINR